VTYRRTKILTCHRLSSTEPRATPSTSVTVTPRSHFEFSQSTRNRAHNVGPGKSGEDCNTSFLPYRHPDLITLYESQLRKLGQCPLEYVLGGQFPCFRWEQSPVTVNLRGLLVYIIVYYTEIVPDTRLPSRRPVHLPSGPL